MTDTNKVGEYVSKKIFSYTRSIDSGGTKASLALLRRGVGKHPGELPELWGAFLKDLPEELMSKTGEPSRAEWAIYTALTLFALHQQGHSEPMDAQGEEHRLGRAVRRLVHGSGDDSNEERVKFKLGLAANSDDMAELSYRLRSIVNLLGNENIKLDYTDLAKDLFLFQSEKYADNIRMKWGQDFYRSTKTDDDGKEVNDEK